VAQIDIIADKKPPSGLRTLLRRKLAALMDELGHGDKELTVIFCSDDQIRELKRQHWGENTATDVLSFPTFEPGDPFVPPHLGDVWISLDTAARQAEEAEHSLAEEVLILAAHALWHLLGHDHQNDESWQGFKQVQERILQI